MGIEIKKRSLCGGEVIFKSVAANTVAGAITEMRESENYNLSRADLRWADLRWAYLNGANLSGANLKGAEISWDSHDLIAEILRQSAADNEGKRMVAGLVLVSRDWCWKEFAALEIAPELKAWAFGELAKWASGNDPSVPGPIASWMKQEGGEEFKNGSTEISA